MVYYYYHYYHFIVCCGVMDGPTGKQWVIIINSSPIICANWGYPRIIFYAQIIENRIYI